MAGLFCRDHYPAGCRPCGDCLIMHSAHQKGVDVMDSVPVGHLSEKIRIYRLVSSPLLYKCVL
jgi:hypothetical protein